jgi:hypothetical protein
LEVEDRMKMTRMRRVPGCLLAAALALPAAAQEDIDGKLLVELNTIRETETGCELSFLATNGHAEDLGSAVFEVVLFDTGGQVERLTLLDFGTLPAARPRVRQFVLPGAGCAGLGMVLFNGATECSGAPSGAAACGAALELRSRVNVEVAG